MNTFKIKSLVYSSEKHQNITRDRFLFKLRQSGCQTCLSCTYKALHHTVSEGIQAGNKLKEKPTRRLFVRCQVITDRHKRQPAVFGINYTSVCRFAEAPLPRSIPPALMMAVKSTPNRSKLSIQRGWFDLFSCSVAVKARAHSQKFSGNCRRSIFVLRWVEMRAKWPNRA